MNGNRLEVERLMRRLSDKDCDVAATRRELGAALQDCSRRVPADRQPIREGWIREFAEDCDGRTGLFARLWSWWTRPRSFLLKPRWWRRSAFG